MPQLIYFDWFWQVVFPLDTPRHSLEVHLMLIKGGIRCQDDYKDENNNNNNGGEGDYEDVGQRAHNEQLDKYN